jgi:anthranilate/para-aminobenzoate synthase component II
MKVYTNENISSAMFEILNHELEDPKKMAVFEDIVQATSGRELFAAAFCLGLQTMMHLVGSGKVQISATKISNN